MNINEALFEAIIEAAGPNGKLLELGSGETSGMFVERGLTVTSIEHDEAWIGKYPGVNYIHAPLREIDSEAAMRYFGTKEWYDTAIIKAYAGAEYDVLFVDGPPRKWRGLFFYNWKLFNTKVPWFFDDTHRPEWYRSILWTAQARGFHDLLVREISTKRAWIKLEGQRTYGRDGNAGQTA